MQKFKQLSLEQRYQIEALLKAEKNQSEIALLLGVHKSTISRELKRNTPRKGFMTNRYGGRNAQRRTRLRHEHKTKHLCFTPKMQRLIVKWMKQERLSPELIHARAYSEGKQMVSHETIYKWIWMLKGSCKRKDKELKYLYKYLKHDKRRRKRGRLRDTRGLIIGRVSIEQRPRIVNTRKRIGDLEVDLMMGKNHQSALLVITDRATIRTKLRKLNSKFSKHIQQKTVQALKNEKPFIKTITFDNDKAFANHLQIAKQLNAKTFFTRPYTSQDKGTVENRIGVIRMFFPKKTDFNEVTHQQIKRVENLINKRPVRKFNYLTPDQLYCLKRKVAFIT